ncbi:hypothetical protein [Nannocystis punicea]|uniref:Lipoprotein n=1 Tax=Nannocystis punicea TaxID=2995304 RepID=A0ABY7HGF7_9BACT|nr:hypothetical protein [Nannocystis poenicansa]WAS98398.1 hypothetical protein O0S08_19830 [Nannocystis poenicansa]
MVLPACGGEKGGETEGETGTSDPGTGEPGTGETDPGETDSGEPGTGETSPGATETGETGETSETSEAPTGTTGDEPLLETCVFDPPCFHEIDPDFTNSEQAVYDGLVCAWSRLRDAAPSRVDLTFAGDDPTSLIPLGDPGRSVLVVKSPGGVEAVQRCTLAPVAFFAACIDDGPQGLDEGCAFGLSWYDGCVDEPAPVCPG